MLAGFGIQSWLQSKVWCEDTGNHTGIPTQWCVCPSARAVWRVERSVHGQRHKKVNVCVFCWAKAPSLRVETHTNVLMETNLFRKLVIPSMYLSSIPLKKSSDTHLYISLTERMCCIGKSKMFKTDYVIFEDFILLTSSEVKLPST